ncbi:hypothetical protein Bint_2707 [Brachyspira intermedia PWS/A]|uniref:Uncharacterized protein n=1 Tax=Brachyspira intermedia (strain ATCC 51140 / PWS/A) TaxID=1045858 RepID=G0EQ43_BRAIP|nr:hypothetical protein [Brachyspira intermedia]AEM23301.1 hypothetical protein Bint_2707 [Brachyspira intermedia PWS/A]
MKTKIFILLMILILAFSCSKNNPVSALGTGSDTGIESGGTDTGTEEGSGGEDTGTGTGGEDTGTGTGEGDTGGTDTGETTIGIIYAGTYTGKAVKTRINNITEEEKVVEDVILVVNKDSTAIFKTASLGDYTFEKFEKIANNDSLYESIKSDTMLFLSFDKNTVTVNFIKKESSRESIIYGNGHEYDKGYGDLTKADY